MLETLETLAPGRNGEIQLTDALVQQIEKPGLLGYRFGGKRFDCGSKRLLNAADTWTSIGQASQKSLDSVIALKARSVR